MGISAAYASRRAALSRVWSETLAVIRSQVTRENYNTYFRPIRLATITENHVVLEVNDDFFRDWIKDHYFNLLTRSLTQASGQAFTIELRVSENPIQDPHDDQADIQEKPAYISRSTRRDAVSEEFPINPNFHE